MPSNKGSITNPYYYDEYAHVDKFDAIWDLKQVVRDLSDMKDRLRGDPDLTHNFNLHLDGALVNAEVALKELKKILDYGEVTPSVLTDERAVVTDEELIC